MDYKIHRDANTFFNALPTVIKDDIAEFIEDLVAGKTSGQTLGNHSSVGDLTGCYKAYFDNARIRVVYRFVPSNRRRRILYILAIGYRRDFQVYKQAFAVQERLKTSRGWWIDDQG